MDDLNPTGYAQVVEETGAAQRVYTYGLQRISEYQVINSAWTPSFYGYDGMGSVRQLVNASGAITKAVRYGLATSSPSAPERFRSMLYEVGGDDDGGVIRMDVLRRAPQHASAFRMPLFRPRSRRSLSATSPATAKTARIGTRRPTTC